MKPVRFIPILLLVAFSSTACESKDLPGPRGESDAEASVHATASAKPGSYEDWCAEHQVPESQCTRCNRSLEAAFRATGDWCPEHGLPESQCLRCNPELKIERPPRSKE